MMCLRQGLKFMSRDEFYHLRKYRIMMCQGLFSCLFFNELWKFHCNKTSGVQAFPMREL